jgi:hypothetical protein
VSVSQKFPSPILKLSFQVLTLKIEKKYEETRKFKFVSFNVFFLSLAEIRLQLEVIIEVYGL